MGWRSKFVFLLIVYFAGFATAIYCLAPAPQTAKGAAGSRGLFGTTLDTDKIVASINSGIHKCVEASKQSVAQAAEMIQQKVEEAQSQAERQ